jgi:hypothetical protein
MLLAGATVSTAALADNTAMSRDEVRSMVSEMLSDAETRSSLLQGGGMAGYDNGFLIGSADGNWKLKMNGLIQFRYIADFRNKNDIPAGADDLTHGFQMRKARLTFSGNAVNPNLTYFIALEDTDTNDSAGTWGMNDCYFGYNLQDGWKIRGGQYKVGWLKEELNSEKTTLAMERGIFNNLFNQGRSQGVGFTYDSNDWRWAFDFTDGLNSANTDFNASTTSAAGTTTPGEWSGTARGEWKWTGSWDALQQYTSKPGDAQAGAVGFAATYQHGNEPAALTNSQDFWGLTADVQWSGGGWNAFGAFAYTYIEQPTKNINQMGGTLQGGYRWNETSEAFAKVDAVWLDNDDAGVSSAFDDNIYFLTFGYNHYFAGNAAKFTLDCIIALSETQNLATADFGPMGGTAESTANGLLGSSKSGEFAIRAQFQLAF